MGYQWQVVDHRPPSQSSGCHPKLHFFLYLLGAWSHTCVLNFPAGTLTVPRQCQNVLSAWAYLWPATWEWEWPSHNMDGPWLRHDFNTPAFWLRTFLRIRAMDPKRLLVILTLLSQIELPPSHEANDFVPWFEPLARLKGLYIRKWGPNSQGVRYKAFPRWRCAVDKVNWAVLSGEVAGRAKLLMCLGWYWMPQHKSATKGKPSNKKCWGGLLKEPQPATNGWLPIGTCSSCSSQLVELQYFPTSCVDMDEFHNPLSHNAKHHNSTQHHPMAKTYVN